VTIERFFADLGYTPYAKTVPVEDGAIEVPEGPGLGAEPEPELIERYRIPQ
jgi:L-alanine-DL-glutamate epimerase-like enolase superfamily enzyme